MSSLGYICPDSLGFRGHPQAGLQRVTSTMIRVVRAAAGWISVRRLFPKALNLKDSVAAKSICRSAW